MLNIMGLFHYLINIKMYHWTTESHPRHVATDKLLDKITPIIDKFVESFIGLYGRGHFAENIPPITVKIMDDSQAAACLDSFADFIRANIVPRVSGNEELKNMTDEIIIEISQCKYLFTLN